VWHYDKIRRSVSTVAIYNGLLFIADLAGYLHCLDVTTGKPHWTHDLLAAVWGSPMVINGKVYIGDEDGDVSVLEASAAKKLVAETNMGSAIYSTATPANGTLFIVGRSRLWALAEKR
jgi:outer membrane protein assembly factor BamB